METNKRWTELANKMHEVVEECTHYAIDELLSLLRLIEKSEDETTRN
jgi:hypothetical protein